MINAAIIAANAACTVAAQVATHAALQANRRLRDLHAAVLHQPTALSARAGRMLPFLATEAL